MSYIDRPVTGQSAGKVQASSLLTGVNPPLFTSLSFIFPASNAGQVGVGDSTMAALPSNAYAPNSDTTYPPAMRDNAWSLSAIYFWFETAGDVVYIRGNSL
jgi:hypothetical protein